MLSEKPRIERESLLLEMSRDALDDELTTDEIAKQEMAMDKEFIQLIQGACKADNIPRAIELSKLLHHTGSFDMAIKVAEFYHLIGFKEKVEMLKMDREENEDRLVVAREKRRQWRKPDPPARQLPRVNGTSLSRPKVFQEFGPPPMIARPGLARATPRIETTRFSSGAPRVSVAGAEMSADLSESPESKRKRDDDAEDVSGSEFAPKQSKYYWSLSGEDVSYLHFS
jgi:chromosome transmission fidelity protein 4